jgi:S1-C subfamily serine protease
LASSPACRDEKRVGKDEGLGFAIPMDTVKTLIGHIVTYGCVMGK